jgi:uroporphyrinogen-III synthase
MQLQQLERYTHLAFTSRNGIQAVLERLAALKPGRDPGQIPAGPDGLAAAAARLNALQTRCCALGADAELLAQAGVEDVLTPEEVLYSSLGTDCSASLKHHM